MRSLIAAAALLALAACGSGDDGSFHGEYDEGSSGAVHNTSDIVGHINAKRADYGYVARVNGTGCEIQDTILTDANAVELYAGAGDPVAANPSRTAGVVVTDDETATCLDLLNEALADFE